jgi:RimJ/RimL family protein N-acetyltransferase
MAAMSRSMFWPLHDLRIRTDRLELRLASYDDLVALAQLAHDGIHDEAEMPFGMPWTDQSPVGRARSTMQVHWRMWGALTPESWSLPFVVVEDGRVVGTQQIDADGFAVRRSVSTGSWVGRQHQGRGIGKEMRAAVLHLAFVELGALWATTSAFDDNDASLGVTRHLGYEPDGMDIHDRRGAPATMLRFRMSAAQWEQGDRIPVTVVGIEPCRALLGAD